MVEAAQAQHLAEELAALRALTEFQHQEMVEKLDSRFFSLEKLVRDAPRRLSYMERSAESDRPCLGKEHESLEVPSYVSFASHDLKLKACTDSADAQISRRKFASQKTRSDAGGQKMPNRVATMVQNPAFDAFFGFVVITNAVFIGIDLEMSTSPGTPDLGMYLAFRVVQYLYTFLFTIELLLRIRAADGLTGFMWTDDWHWNFLDIFIVTSSLWEIIVDFTHMLGEQGLGSLAGVSSLKAFRIIRITRVVKTVRVIRLFRFVLKLRTLITSIASTLTSLFWAMILLTLVIYVFAILFAQTVNDYVRHPDMMSAVMTERDKLAAERYFKDLPTTMLSLFMSIAGGVSWEEVIAPLMSISSIWAWVFLFYFFFTYFAVLNVVTAVFCQSAIDSAQSDHTMMVQSILDDKEAHLEKIKALFSQMAYNEEGGITFAMFEEKINSAAVKEYFATLGLDVWDAWSFFKLLDADAGGSVEIEEFLMGCLRLRGQATAIDVGKILQDQEFLIKNQDRFFGVLDAELRDLKMELATLRYAASGSDPSGSSGPGPGMARTLDL